jgi:hypothetical protein
VADFTKLFWPSKETPANGIWLKIFLSISPMTNDIMTKIEGLHLEAKLVTSVLLCYAKPYNFVI